MATKAKKTVVLHLRKLFNSFVPVDDDTAGEMENLEPNSEHYFQLKKVTEADLRSAAQNRLLWAWYTDMEKTKANEFAGTTKEDWHFEMKKRFLVPIFERDDDGFALMMVALRNVRDSGLKADAKALHRHIVSETSTTKATTAQFSEYLGCISRFCGERGIWLRTDNYLMGMAL